MYPSPSISWHLAVCPEESIYTREMCKFYSQAPAHLSGLLDIYQHTQKLSSPLTSPQAHLWGLASPKEGDLFCCGFTVCAFVHKADCAFLFTHLLTSA